MSSAADGCHPGHLPGLEAPLGRAVLPVSRSAHQPRIRSVRSVRPSRSRSRRCRRSHRPACRLYGEDPDATRPLGAPDLVDRVGPAQLLRHDATRSRSPVVPHQPVRRLRHRPGDSDDARPTTLALPAFNLLSLVVVLIPPVRVVFSIRLVRSLFRRGNLVRFLIAALSWSSTARSSCTLRARRDGEQHPLPGPLGVVGDHDGDHRRLRRLHPVTVGGQ